MKKIILIFFLSLLPPQITSAQIIILKNCYTIGHTPEQTEFYKNHYPFFDSEKSLQLKSNITDFCFKKSIIKYKINKVLKKLKLNY